MQEQDISLKSVKSVKDIDIDAIAVAMVASNSLEDLLKTFLTVLGENLAVDRVAVYQFINHYEGRILVEAIAPNLISIKDQIYPINYFGVDSRQGYPRDRAVILPDLAQITETLITHQYWQKTQVRAMISAPILFDSANVADQLWGIALVQQCHLPRQWQPQETQFLFAAAQILGQCLQYWKIRLRSRDIPDYPPNLQEKTSYPQLASDLEEIIVKRVNLAPDQLASQDTTSEISISNSSILLDTERNPSSYASIHSPTTENSLEKAINAALQSLDHRIHKASPEFPIAFGQIYNANDDDLAGVNSEANTLEDILEECFMENPQILQLSTISQETSQNTSEYLYSKISSLLDTLQQKLEEIESLKSQVQSLHKSQQEFRQILQDLQSEDLADHLKTTVINMYRSLL